MPLAKSKLRSQMAAVPSQSPLPLATLCLLGALLFDQIAFSSAALKCYQGQMPLQNPVSGSPVDCPMQAYTCIKSVDYSQGLVTRACASTNCSMQGGYQITYSSLCINSTGYPPQTFCCCYGDGCNSATTLGNPLGAIVLAMVGLIVAMVVLKNEGASGRII